MPVRASRTDGFRDGRNRQFAQGAQACRKRARRRARGGKPDHSRAHEGGAVARSGTFGENAPASRCAQDRSRRRAVKSPVVKRSIVIAGHKTSVSLEEAFWNGLKDIAAARRVSLSDLVGSIDTERQHGNLSSAIRLFVLNHYQKRMAPPS